MIFLTAYTLLLAVSATAQVTLTGTNSITSTGADYPTGTDLTYATDGATSTLSGSSEFGTLFTDSSTTMASNASSISASRTILTGSASSTTSTALNGTSLRNGTTTSTSAAPTNTQPCNGHPSFCTRKFSNITYVAAHNSPFVRPGNAASNQMLPVTTQLQDGVRMLQFQTHKLNDTIYLCHTSCDLLNAGTLEAYLVAVVGWLRQNPYDVITILMGNSDVLNPQEYVEPITKSGLINYVYAAPEIPMPLESWPTLTEMILRNERAVVMLDYQANQTAIPWLLDEFSQMWETPFSPTERSFPCTPQRPPNRPREVREDRMYMANHNLNVNVALAGISLDVPAYSLLNETNGVTGFGSAGWAVANCTADWSRPPNFLLVDYYNLGNFNGSVFAVAAKANNVTYDRSSCCGNVAPSSDVERTRQVDLIRVLVVVAVVSVIFG